MYDFETLYIFFMALAITLLYSIREVIEKGFHKTRSYIENGIILVTKSITSGLIVIIGFDALQQLDLTVTLFDMTIHIQDKVAIFLAVVTVLFSDELISRMRNVIGGKK